MPLPPLFLASCEAEWEGQWDLTGLGAPIFLLIKKLSAGVFRETYLVKSTHLAQFKGNTHEMSFEAPNSLAPPAFLSSKGLNPLDYKMAVVTSQRNPIAAMPTPQSGPNTRFEVRNNASAVVGQLFRSDNAGSWQDTWALSANFVAGNATTDVRPKIASGLPADPAGWATQAKTAAAGGQYIQYSYTFGPVS